MLVSRPMYLDNSTKYTALQNWIALQKNLKNESLSDVENLFLAFCEEHINESRSQILQDLFVLWATNFKENGVFLEFGAADGITHSNTYLLENSFNWRGLLIEPLPAEYRFLKKNRIASQCVRAAVDPLFSEYPTKSKLRVAGQLSGLEEFLQEDYHSERRSSAATIEVPLVNLNKLLASSVFSKIDYMSIDTEGSETEIVSNFDWLNFSPKVVTIETNGRDSSEVAILSLMKNAGYSLFGRRLSRWDMWFIKD